jgi:hypothetical protein
VPGPIPLQAGSPSEAEGVIAPPPAHLLPPTPATSPTPTGFSHVLAARSCKPVRIIDGLIASIPMRSNPKRTQTN